MCKKCEDVVVIGQSGDSIIVQCTVCGEIFKI